jgi:hypothetical protein
VPRIFLTVILSQATLNFCSIKFDATLGLAWLWLSWPPMFYRKYLEPVWSGFSRLWFLHYSSTVAETREAPNVVPLRHLFLVHFCGVGAVFRPATIKTVLYSILGARAGAPGAAPNTALFPLEFSGAHVSFKNEMKVRPKFVSNQIDAKFTTHVHNLLDSLGHEHKIFLLQTKAAKFKQLRS